MRRAVIQRYTLPTSSVCYAKFLIAYCLKMLQVIAGKIWKTNGSLRPCMNLPPRHSQVLISRGVQENIKTKMYTKLHQCKKNCRLWRAKATFLPASRASRETFVLHYFRIFTNVITSTLHLFLFQYDNIVTFWIFWGGLNLQIPPANAFAYH